jgi:hypothetical protein
VLASYLASGAREPLAEYLQLRVFAGTSFAEIEPRPEDLVGFVTYLDRYRAGLAIEAAASQTI